MSSEVSVYMKAVQDFLSVYGVALGLVLIFFLLAYLMMRKAPGEEAMKKMTKGEYVLSRRQQKLREHSKIADGIASMLLDLFAKGELTEERYQYWHLRFGTQLALKELLPVKLTHIQLKEAMKKRTSNGVYKPVKLPGHEEKQPKAKNIIDKILSRHAVQS